MQSKEERILRLLDRAQLVTPAQIESTRAQSSPPLGLVDALIQNETVSEDDVSRLLATEAGIEWIDLSAKSISPETITQIQAADAREFQVIPVGTTDASLLIALADPFDLDAIDSLRFLLQRHIELVCASATKIRQALVKFYGAEDDSVATLGTFAAPADSRADLVISANTSDGTGPTDAPVVRMISSLFIDAHRMGASDIHLEPLENKLQVRFRIDGVLRQMLPAPKRLHSAIVSRLKIMTGSMSIAEKRLPQDGRIQVQIGGKPIELRASTIPTTHGESVVMRVLDKSTLMLGLTELGFFEQDRETFSRLLRAPDGIVLVTGPTGSGKTSTLYSCLNFINKPDRKIITVEEPVEYQMAGINQVQVNSEIGMTFAVALRSILRQAPNIILIGEIRDRETATIATNASLTGHLVFSTLHTNDAPTAVARLVDIGVQPFLVASAIRAIVAQRLVRRLCSVCKQPATSMETVQRSLNLTSQWSHEWQPMTPSGCNKCHDTGYKGRVGLFEIFVLDDEARRLISQHASTAAIRQHARRNGMRTLREDGVHKVLAGLTSVDEVISSTLAHPS